MTAYLQVRAKPLLPWQRHEVSKIVELCSIIFFNQPIEVSPQTLARYMTATVDSDKNPFFGKHRLWMLDVAKEIRESAVSDAVSALKTCLTNVERGHQKTFDIKIKQTREHGSFGVEKKIVWKEDALIFKFEKV